MIGDEDEEAAAERIMQAAPLLPLADALQLKENSIARLRKVEADRAEDLVVPVDAGVKLFSTACAHVRTRLLALPSNSAPHVARLKTPAEVEDFLQALITEALEALSSDEGDGDFQASLMAVSKS